MDLRLVDVDIGNERLLEAVIEMGDRHRRKLGLLPQEAFRERAAQGTLLAAVSGGRPAGYALYGLPRQEIRLAHLCVAPEWTGHGVARMLVEGITHRHPDRRGIKLNCRRDYGLDGMWRSLGFAPLRDREGRGRDGALLTTWWKDHGLPDLFSAHTEDAPLVVAIDLPTLAAMHGLSGSAADRTAQALHAEWLSDLLQVVVTPALLHDVNGLAGHRERSRAQNAVQGYPRPRCQENTVRRHMERLAATDHGGTAAQPERLRHVAEAAAAGAHVLVSTDESLTASADEIWAKCQVHVLPPAALVSRVHSLHQARDYSPGLLGTSLTARVLTSWEDGLLLPFGSRQEAGVDDFLAERLRSVLSHRDGRCAVIADTEGQPLALYAWHMDEHVLEVRILRTRPHRLEPTLARQLVFTLRRHCRDNGCQAIRVTDPAPPEQVRSALDTDGFARSGDHRIGLVIDVCADTATVAAAAGDTARRLGVAPPPVPATAPAAARIERLLWPAKTTDSELPSFLVPIAPGPADLLFGLGPSLFPRPDELGLSREHVYYRAPRKRGEQAPARLLWYASRERKAVVACSRLDEIVIGDADALYDRFRHLGVFDRHQVRKIARSHANQAMALRFCDTEVFEHPVPLVRLRALAAADGRKLALQSISKIDARTFRAVYKEGRSQP